MNKIRGAIFLLAIAIVGLGVYWLADKYYFSPRRVAQTSDAVPIRVIVRAGGDGYTGYYFLTCAEMKKQLARRGIGLDFKDDGGAYADRLEKFAKGQLDCIVLPVADYLRHGKEYDYPGVIVVAISESKGADAIVGWSDVLPTGTVNDLNDSDLRIAYTSASPSSFLLDIHIDRFDLYNLKSSNSWRHETESSEAAYDSLLSHQVDVAVLWEPWVLRALEKPGIVKISGSDRTREYIKDVFVFSRDFLSKEKNRQAVLDFLDIYFRVLDSYSLNKDKLIEEISKSEKMRKDQVDTLLQEIDWYNLEENCYSQFGLDGKDDDLVYTIIQCSKVLVESGVFSSDPLKLGDPYSIINSSFLEELAKKKSVNPSKALNQVADFKPLDDVGWAGLKEFGMMRADPIYFDPASDLLTDAGKSAVSNVVELFKKSFPSQRLLVIGNTIGGDESANVALSKRRADVVAQYMIVLGIDPDRIHPKGAGSSRPPTKRPGENAREYRYRMSRVEFVLLDENTL